MAETIKCPYCGSENTMKGQQEMFPSTFMPATEGRFGIFRSLTQSKEFDLYACLDCGFTSWFMKPKYLNKEIVKAS